MMHKDFIGIIGAGPGGLICAKKLTETGIPVLLFDDKVPWEKPCGGIIPSSVSQINLRQSVFPYPSSVFPSLKVVSTRGLHGMHNYPMPYYVVSRRDLSLYIMSGIDPEKISVINERVKKIEKRRSQWEIITKNRTCGVSLIVGADGAGSIVRRTVMGPIPHNHLAMTYGLRFKNEGSHRIAAFFSDIIGYSWIINGAAGSSAGIMAQCKTINPHMLLGRLHEMARTRIPGAKAIGTYSALIPSADSPSFFDGPSCGDGWVLVGDAAGHVDPIIGEGISYAMKSGECAARAIIKGNTSLYEHYWRELYGDMLVAIAHEKVKMLNMSKNFGSEMYGALQYAYLANPA